MKNSIRIVFGIFLGVCLTLLFVPAYAQTVDATATSGSQSGASTTTRVENALSIDNTQRESTTLRTAPGHALAAATNSFSGDYCGGTAQVGASGLGWSLGGSKQAYDKNCQALRRVEKFGQLATHAENLKMSQVARDLTMMAVWQLCSIDAAARAECLNIGLVVEQK